MRSKLFALCLLAYTPAAFAEDDAHGPQTFSSFRLETESGATLHEASIQTWDMNGWLGGDSDKLIIQSQGKLLRGVVHDADAIALYSHAISDFWDAQVGIGYSPPPRNLRSARIRRPCTLLF